MARSSSLGADAHQARTPGAIRSRSASAIVTLRLKGWQVGDGPLQSGPLNLLAEEAGLDLTAALEAVDRLLDGEDVSLPLPFPSEAEARSAVSRLGARPLG